MKYILFIFFILEFISCKTYKESDLQKFWPVTMYGGEGGSYASSHIIKGYIIVKKDSLKGLYHRTFEKGLSLDTLLMNDTIICRIKLFSLHGFTDIMINNSNVLSIPNRYISGFYGTNRLIDSINITKWVILFNRYFPYGRLIAKRGKVTIYDNNDVDTSHNKYRTPFAIINGSDTLYIKRYLLNSAKYNLFIFIKKQYSENINENYFKNEKEMIDYILEKENERLSQSSIK